MYSKDKANPYKAFVHKYNFKSNEEAKGIIWTSEKRKKEQNSGSIGWNKVLPFSKIVKRYVNAISILYTIISK